MHNPKIGVGIIGTGMAAVPHAKSLFDLKNQADVRGVHSRRREGCEAFAERYGFPVAASIDAMVGDERLDAVILITPPNERVELVRSFAEAGKHILTEKPIERTTQAAEQIVGICEDNDVQLGVVFQHRFRSASEKLKELVDDGSLGKIGIVRVNVPWWREQSYYDESGRGTYERDGGGVLISQAIHTLDLMLSLTGPVAEVQAMVCTTSFHKMEAEDFAAGGMRFENGAHGAIMATTAAFPGDAESIAMDCERASVHMQSGTLTVNWRNGRTEEYGEPAITGSGADPMDFPYDWHRDLIADFLEAVRDNRPPRVSGREALHVHRLIDALIASSREKRTITIENGS